MSDLLRQPAPAAPERPRLDDLDVVFLAWRESPAMLERHHAAVASALPDGWSGAAVLVENAAAPPTRQAAREQLRRTYPGARRVVLAAPRNLGFARAMNLALDACSGRYVALVNSDGEPAAGLFERLVDALETHPDAVWAGPAVHGPGEPCEPPGPAFEEERMAGVSLLIRREAFLALGGFDPLFFFYNEDFDASERIRAAGGTLLRVPGARFRHGKGGRLWRGRLVRERHFARTDQMLVWVHDRSRINALRRLARSRPRALAEHARGRDTAALLGILAATLELPRGLVAAERRRRRPWDGERLRAWLDVERDRVQRLELG